MQAIVTFTRVYSYEVEGETERDCEAIAFRQFENDIVNSNCALWYDDVTLESIEDGME